MNRKFSNEELCTIRNKIPVKFVLEQLCGNECKEIEGYIRFVCPVCHEMQTSLHPKENLGRCFRCKRNFNAIEFVMSGCRLSFVESVKLLRSHFRVRDAHAASSEAVSAAFNSRSNIS